MDTQPREGPWEVRHRAVGACDARLKAQPGPLVYTHEAWRAGAQGCVLGVRTSYHGASWSP